MKQKVTRKNAIELHCWECMGHYADGKADCGCKDCALYPYMPYKRLTPSLKWYDYHARSKGKIKLQELTKRYSTEMRQQARERLLSNKE